MPEHRNEMLERVVRRAVQGARERMVGIRITDCVVTIVSSDAVDAVLPLEGEQLHEGTFNHIAEGHRDLAPHRRDVEATLVSPDFILSNAATFGRSSFQKQRTADVRYVRFSEKLGLHIVVPAETVQVHLQIGDDDPVSQEGRVARTAYPTAQVPSNARRLYWRST